MAGQLSNKGEQLALAALFNDGAKPVYVGLSTAVSGLSDTTQLTSVSEVTDTAYARKAVTFSAAADISGQMGVQNTIAIDFAAWAANAPSKITSIFLTYAASGTSGDILAWFNIDLANQIQPTAGQPVRIPANGLVITLD